MVYTQQSDRPLPDRTATLLTLFVRSRTVSYNTHTIDASTFLDSPVAACYFGLEDTLQAAIHNGHRLLVATSDNYHQPIAWIL